MKVISIGSDRKIFDENSAVRQRVVEYGRMFKEMHVVVFTTRAMNYEPRIKLSDNVYVYATNSRNRLFYIWDAIKTSKRIIKNSKSIIQDSVISCQDPFETGFVGLIAKMIYKLPLQIQIHTDFINRYFILHSLLNLIRFPLGLFVLSFADSARAVSQRIANSIHSLSHNVSVLPVRTGHDIRDASHETRKNPNKIVFLAIARLEKEKDLDTAITAFKGVIDAGIDAEFTIVGDGSQRKSLEHLSRILNLESRIKLVGWQNNASEYYQNADIYISTSLYEGYGMSTVEAASYGLPLVISNTGVVGDIFNNGEEALVCKQKDVNSFAMAFIELARDNSLRIKMGERARISALRHRISKEEYLQKYRESLADAIQNHNNGRSIFAKNILLRYFCAGITGASTQIGLLYIFTDILGVWYIRSSIIAFAVAVCVSFILQKFWTFRDGKLNQAHHQFLSYLGVAVAGIVINTALMFVFVDAFGIWYILAQVIAGAFIMVFNFMMYKFFIFHKK